MKAIILAAGKGKRLTNKYSLLINNKTLIEHQYDKLKNLTDDICVVYNQEQVKDNHSHLNVVWLYNESGTKQESIKQAIKNSDDTCLIVLADMLNLQYDKYFELSNTTFSMCESAMPPVVVNKKDFDFILKSEFNSLKDILKYETVNITPLQSQDIDYIEDVIKCRKNIVVVSGGDIASPTINLLAKCGYNVIVVEKEFPLAVRRFVSYSEAIYESIFCINDVCVKRSINIEKTLCENMYPIITEKEFDNLNIDYDVIIDITLRKRRIKYDGISIGVGPGFIAPIDTTYVIESMRGNTLGQIIKNGSAINNTKIPATICGYSNERVLYSPRNGIFETKLKIGDFINKGDVFATVGNCNVHASISGIIRGQIRNGTVVNSNVKIGDINPIENDINIKDFSDKGKKIANSILTLVEEIL